MAESKTDVFGMMKEEILANAEEKAKEILNRANQIDNEISEDAKKNRFEGQILFSATSRLWFAA